MPKPKKTVKTKPDSLQRGLYLLLAAMVGLACLWIFSLNYHARHPKSSSFIVGQSEPAVAYKSLDLRQAAKASFPSQPLQVTRDLGVDHGVARQVVRFSVIKDNLDENALLTMPTTPKPAAGYPLLILCHGYYNPVYYPTESAYLPDMEFYSQHGFAVLKPDFRGQGLSAGVGAPEGAYYSMAYNTDVMSLISAARLTNYLDKDNISIWGHSMGAYIALRAAVLSPYIKNAVLLSGPVGSIQDMFSSYVAISDTNNAVAADLRANELAQHGTPLSNPSYWNQTSPLNFLARSKAFIQIHVGSADEVVPPHFSADLDSALSANHKPHEYFVYAGAGHGLLPQRGLIWQRSLARLSQKS